MFSAIGGQVNVFFQISSETMLKRYIDESPEQTAKHSDCVVQRLTTH